MAQKFLSGVKITAGDENTLYLNTGATGQQTAIFYQINGSYKYQQRVGTNYELYNYATSNWDFHLQGSTGYLSIGHNAPKARLHLSGDNSAKSAIRQSRTGVVIWDQAIDSSGRLQWGTRSSETGTRTVRFTLDDNGYNGIGPHAPTAALHVKGTTNLASRFIFTKDLTTDKILFGGADHDNFDTFVGSSSNHSFTITQNGAAAITIDTSKNATFAGDITVNRSVDTSSPIITVSNDDSKHMKMGVVRSAAGTAPNTSFIAYDGDFRLIPGSGSATEKFTLDSSGNATFSGLIKVNRNSADNPSSTGAHLYLVDTRSLAANTGGAIVFSSYYQGTTAVSGGSYVKGYKENATSGDYGYGLKFGVRENGQGLGGPCLTLNSLGNATFTGDIYADGGDIYARATAANTNAMLRAVSSGSGGIAGLGIDAANGDFAGSDYFTLRQLDNKQIEFNARTNTGNTLFFSKGTLNLTQDGANSTFAGVLSLPNGSVSAPSIGNTGDTNTGIYWPDDHQLGFAVNGSRKMYMSETGTFFQNQANGVEINNKLKLNSDGTANSTGAYFELHHENNNSTDVCATINLTNNAGGYAAIVGGTTGANNTGYIEFKTDNAGTQGTVLTLNGDNSATFAGNVESQDTFILNYGGSGNKWQQLFDGSNNWNLRYYNGSNWSSNYLNISTSGNATFAGTIDSKAITALAKGIQLGSSGYYVNSTFKDVADNCGVILGHNDTANGVGAIAGINELAFLTYGSAWTQALLLDSSQNATFAGDLTVEGGQIYINDTNTKLEEGTGNAFRVTTDSGYIDIGPKNSGHCHIETNRTNFYFNKELRVNTGIITSYDEDLSLQRASSADGSVNLNIGMLYSTAKNDSQVQLGGFTLNTALEDTYHVYMPGVSPNTFAGAHRKLTVTATKNGTSISAASLANAFLAHEETVSVQTSNTDTIIIEISGWGNNYGQWYGITFGAAQWRAKDIDIEISSDNGANYTSIYSENDQPHATVRTYHSGNNTVINKIKYTLTNWNTTSTRINHIFGYKYLTGDTNYLDKYRDETMYSSLNFRDNYAATFGNSGDLVIKHNGNSIIETHATDSAGDLYIKSQGTNHDLYLQAADDILIQPQGSENGIRVHGNDNVELYFNNVRKLRTTNTGINVEGEVVATTLDISGNIQFSDGYLFANSVTSSSTTTTVASVSSSTYTAVFFDYSIKNGTNVRAGTVVATHDGTNVEFNETSTVDLGDTSDVTLSVDLVSSNLSLKATTTSSTWTVKSLVRAI